MLCYSLGTFTAENYIHSIKFKLKKNQNQKNLVWIIQHDWQPCHLPFKHHKGLENNVAPNRFPSLTFRDVSLLNMLASKYGKNLKYISLYVERKYQNLTLDDTELLQNKSLWPIKIKWYKSFCVSISFLFFQVFQTGSLLHVPVQICWLPHRPHLSPLVDIFTPPEFLQDPCPELGPVFIVELLEVEGQMELGRVAPQERIVLLLFPNSGGVLHGERGGGQRRGGEKMNWLDFNVNESLCCLICHCFIWRSELQVPDDWCSLPQLAFISLASLASINSCKTPRHQSISSGLQCCKAISTAAKRPFCCFCFNTKLI